MFNALFGSSKPKKDKPAPLGPTPPRPESDFVFLQDSHFKAPQVPQQQPYPNLNGLQISGPSQQPHGLPNMDTLSRRGYLDQVPFKLDSKLTQTNASASGDAMRKVKRHIGDVERQLADRYSYDFQLEREVVRNCLETM